MTDVIERRVKTWVRILKDPKILKPECILKMSKSGQTYEISLWKSLGKTNAVLVSECFVDVDSSNRITIRSGDEYHIIENEKEFTKVAGTCFMLDNECIKERYKNLIEGCIKG